MFGFEQFSSQAQVPEHLIEYVQAINEAQVCIVADCLSYRSQNELVVVAYGLPGQKIDYGKLMQEVVNIKGIAKATILSPVTMDLELIQKDRYWYLPLPCPPVRQKLRNTLRAAQKLLVREDNWHKAHGDLVNYYLGTRQFSSGISFIWQSLSKVVASKKMNLFSAYDAQDKLQGFCIAHLTGFSTGFYLFAFRQPDSLPGTSDILLAHLVERAEVLGLSQINLGLGINSSLEFFKHKWQARAYDHYEYLWQSKSWWRKWL